MSLHYKNLPQGLCKAALEKQRKQSIFGYLSKDLIDSLCSLFEGKKVIEAYAGRGHLSSLLHEKGVSIRSTSIRMGHDRSEELGYAFPVEHLDVVSAVQKYRDDMDFLLVSWPLSDDSLLKSLPFLPSGCLIVFIGEVTDYHAMPAPFLGGCATDAFFEAVTEDKELTLRLRYPTYRVDTIKVYRII